MGGNILVSNCFNKVKKWWLIKVRWFRVCHGMRALKSICFRVWLSIWALKPESIHPLSIYSGPVSAFMVFTFRWRKHKQMNKMISTEHYQFIPSCNELIVLLPILQSSILVSRRWRQEGDRAQRVQGLLAHWEGLALTLTDRISSVGLNTGVTWSD